MPMARHRHLTARDPALINIFALEMVADPLEARKVKAAGV